MDADTPHWNAAALEHLTGPARGNVSWLTADTVDVRLLPDRRLSFSATVSDAVDDGVIARFHRTGGTYDIIATGQHPIWLNGRAVATEVLRYGDVIEFGETGPLSRYRLYDDRHRPSNTVGEMFGDAASYLRTSRRPWPRKLGYAVVELLRRLARETSVVFRALVLLSIAVLAWALYQQGRMDDAIRAELESGNLQIDAVASALSQARDEAIRPSDLSALQQDLALRLQTNAERLMALEARTGAGRRVVAQAAASVVFLQGAYSLRDRESGNMLRHVLGPDGVPVHLPNGQPFLSLTGTGPVAEVQFNGTGFVLADRGVLITNRHVAQPWGKGPGARLGTAEMEPVMTRFIGYFPGQPAPVTLSTLAVSDQVDLAVLAMGQRPGAVPGLTLAVEGPEPGEEVIVMGYPTGLMSLLAQSGTAFVQDLQAAGETGFWKVAERLAAAGLIAPLASRGIVGQATEATVVYDAETTHGGSGGPVLTLDGAVVAVNTAIMPEFGGSNLGVPARHIAALLASLDSGSSN